MIEPIMYFGIGFLVAALIGLVVLALGGGGARGIAFPRLVAFSYWMFLFGGITGIIARPSCRPITMRTAARASSAPRWRRV